MTDRKGLPKNARRPRESGDPVVYTVQLGEDLWVVHAFQKKSTQGIKTPQREIDAIRDRLKRLKEMLR